MTVLDTNLLARVITNDDPEQARKVQRLLQSDVGFVPVTVILETGWVLEANYELTRSVVAQSLRQFLGMEAIRVHQPHRIEQALRWYENGLDFADSMHLAASQHASRLVTFDRAFASGAEGKGQCPVVDLGTKS